MKIAIDLNDVIRDFSDNFLKTYLLQYNREFDTTDFEMWSNNLDEVLPFKSDSAYKRFKYEDYAYEIFAKCGTCGRNLSVEFNKWLTELSEMDCDEPVDAMIVSPMEFGAGLSYTYMFMSKLGSQIREVYFPYDSTTIWDKCDVLVTANTDLIKMKPEGKIVIKIEKEYNGSVKGDYEYKDFSEFIKDINNTAKLLKCDE